MQRLGDLCNVQLGKTPPRGQSRYWDKDRETDNVWLSIADLVHGEEVSDSKEYITDQAADNVNITPAGTLLLSFKLTIGRVSFAGRDLYTNEAIASLLDLSPKLDKRFLFYYFSGFDWDTLTEGDIKLKGKTLNKAKLNELPVPIPPHPEQQRIVTKLDAAFGALREAEGHVERNRANARELFESYLNGVFEGKGDGWVQKALGEVARIRTGKVDANHQKVDGEYPFYTCAFEQFLSPTWSFDGPSVILPGNGANVGVAFYYNGRFEAYQRTYVINEFSNLVYPRFAYYTFRASWKKYIATRQFGSATNYIVLGDLKLFPITLPKMREQEKLVLEFEKAEDLMNQLEATYQQKLRELDGLKKGLLGAAFRGEL